MTEEKTTPAKTRAKKKPAPDWAALAGRSATAPKDDIEREETSAAAPAPIQSNPAVKTTPTGKIVPVTKAQTFRLPLDALQIITDAKAEEAANGRRLTNDAAVTEALHAWAKARQRRKG